MTEIAKVFMNGGSQAIRLPRNYRFTDDEVCINKIGDAVVLTPKNSRWKGLLSSLDMFTDDFMNNDREDLKTETREDL